MSDTAKVEGYTIKKSTRENKKYMVLVGTKWVHFGDKRYEHYKDQTPLKAYENLDHGDENRRRLYVARHTRKKDKNGKYFHKNKSSPEYWSLNYLW